MNTKHSGTVFTLALALGALLLGAMPAALRAQSPTTAYEVPVATNGNQAVKDLVVGSDFYVVHPITIWELGVFDHKGDGIQGEAVLAAQLFSRAGNSGVLLETLTFDATSPGTLRGGQRFKPLVRPLTLLPGAYTIAATGFDALNREGNAGNFPYVSNTPPWRVSDGGGLLRFEGGGRYGNRGPSLFPGRAEKGRADRYAAGTFVYSAAQWPASPFAGDYAELTAGVSHFPVDCCLGSLGVFGRGAFPVIAEPGGRGLVIAAAGRYENRPDGARCVAFAHTQFGQADGDGRARLLDNALLWAGRQGSRSATVVGVMPGLDAERIAGWGYTVKVVSPDVAGPGNDLSGCHVLAVNLHLGATNDTVSAGFSAEAAAQMLAFTAAGGGLVLVATPWAISYMVEQPEFVLSRQLLGPFGLAYRDSQSSPVDWGLTNVAPHPWPAQWSALPAADLLRQDRAGAVRLSGYEKMTALQSINHALSARPDLLCELTSTCLRQPLGAGAGAASSFVELLSLAGAQASTHWLGDWAVVENALEARGRRGAVSYDFVLPVGDVYRLGIEGANAEASVPVAELPLRLSVDGAPVGSVRLVSTNGRSSRAECLLPWLPAGRHTVRIYWDNAANLRALRLTRVTLETGLGGDSDADGMKDWVAARLRGQSGLDQTNGLLASLTSPVCVEGRDPYLPALRCWVGGSGAEARSLAPRMTPNRRWFAEVPLSQDPAKRVNLEVSFQNGALTEMRQFQWQPLDLLVAGDVTLRQGDSLLLTVGTAAKGPGEMVILVGTNQLADLGGMPVPHQFGQAGQYTVTGAWTPPGGVPQSRSITVRVVGCALGSDPVCWVGHVREWNVTNLPPEVVIEADARMLCAELAALPGNGRRYGLLIDESEPRGIVARLGPGGPVLSAVAAQGAEVWSGSQTYNHVLEVYPDGSQLVESMIIAPLLPPGVSIRLAIIVGGVLFEDGTTEKWLTAADFDELGQCRVRYLKAPGVTTSNCHTLELFQNGALVGTR